MKFKRYSLMYCGISPKEIDEMDWEDVEFFYAFFNEMQKAEQGGMNARRSQNTSQIYPR